MAIVTRITMMVITTMSSTKVKPSLADLGVRPTLPLGICRAIGRLIAGFAIDVEDVLSTPARGLGVVLVAAQAPVFLLGEGVPRDPAEEADLLAVGGVEFYALDQDV